MPKKTSVTRLTPTASTARKLAAHRRIVGDLKLPKKLHAKVALTWCRMVTALTVEAGGKLILEEADGWWVNDHYGRLFRTAVNDKHVNFLKDGPMLTRKAVELGQEACRQAGTSAEITLEHAKQASREVDCKPDGLKAMEVWCQP